MGGGKVEARTHQLASTGVLRRLVGRNEVSFPRGASWVEGICPSLLSLSSKEVYFETFYPFPGWGDEGFSDGGKGVWTARGA